MNESSHFRSAEEHEPDQAGAQYVILAITVARKTSCTWAAPP